MLSGLGLRRLNREWRSGNDAHCVSGFYLHIPEVVAGEDGAGEGPTGTINGVLSSGIEFLFTENAVEPASGTIHSKSATLTHQQNIPECSTFT